MSTKCLKINGDCNVQVQNLYSGFMLQLKNVLPFLCVFQNLFIYVSVFLFIYLETSSCYLEAKITILYWQHN